MAEHFTGVAKRDGFPVGKPFAYDESQYRHQVPGGVISNLRHQLRLIGKEERLQETLEEAARARADFGYPIMVLPFRSSWSARPPSTSSSGNDTRK